MFAGSWRGAGTCGYKHELDRAVETLGSGRKFPTDG